MNSTMLTAILVAFVIVVIAWLLIDWLTHLDMTKDHSNRYGWGSYKDFKREFEKYEWESLWSFPDSYENRLHDCYLHANIVKFNGIGMLIRNPIEYFLTKRFVKNEMKNEVKKGNYDWSSKVSKL